VFAGPYLDDPEEREKFSAAYRAMTDAFLALPLCVPGTDVWKGKQGRLYIIKILTKAAARSKAKMAAGEEPVCLLDFWSIQVRVGAGAGGRRAPKEQHQHVHQLEHVRVHGMGQRRRTQAFRTRSTPHTHAHTRTHTPTGAR
jgi:hypothetical protein